MTAICACGCGREFELTRSDRKYFEHSCSDKGGRKNRSYGTGTCEYCKKEFLKRSRKQRFCGIHCARVFNADLEKGKPKGKKVINKNEITLGTCTLAESCKTAQEFAEISCRTLKQAEALFRILASPERNRFINYLKRKEELEAVV